MKFWKRAAFYAFGWVAKILATSWLSTCRISEFGRGIEKRYLRDNPGKGLLYASWHRGLFFVNWLSGCKHGFIPYLQNNWTLHVLTIVTFYNYDYNLPNQPINQ
jgi:hypothetical protein